MNEREFDNGGTSRMKLPLISLFGASNEMPDGRELEAFWDRFLLRLVVNPVSEAGFEKLVNLLVNPQPASTACLGLSGLQALQSQAAQIGFTPSVRLAYLKLRKELVAKGITASDRRWGQCLKLLQAHALIEGRQTVEEDDLVILEHALWDTPEQRSDIKKQVGQLANPTAAKAVELFDQASNIHQTALAAYRQANNEDDKSRVIVEAVGKLKTALQNIITGCTPEHRVTLEAGGREGVKNVVANLSKASQTRSLNKIENIIVQVSRMRDELVEHVS
jgi:MoxR-like ATPase